MASLRTIALVLIAAGPRVAVGWQVATPLPDDLLYETLAGDDANPAVAGYDPDVAAELYTTNGDTDTHMTVAHDTLGFTPEMTTCEVASAKYDDDPWEPEDCVSGFNFPVHINHAGDGSNRLFVAEVGGRIRIVKNGAVLPTPFLDISSRQSRCPRRAAA